MAANTKVMLQGQSILERLNTRLADASYPTPVTMSFSSGDVLLTLDKSASDLADRALILMAPVAPLASGATDALGLTQRVYSPHVIQVLFDKDVSNGALGTAEASKFAILGECLRTGMRVELYEVDAAEKQANKFLEIGDCVVANLVGSFDSLEWGFRAGV